MAIPSPIDPTVDDPPITPNGGPIDERHPLVRRLRREVAQLRAANQRLVLLQRELINRDVIAARLLEPLNPAAAGRIEPVVGLPTVIHVDNLRLLRNRVMGVREPTIRLLVGGKQTADIRHCHSLRLLGPSELLEAYDDPVPRRPSAVVVLTTTAPVDVVR